MAKNTSMPMGYSYRCCESGVRVTYLRRIIRFLLAKMLKQHFERNSVGK